MADEQTKPPFNADPFIPEGLDWPSLLSRDGDEPRPACGTGGFLLAAHEWISRNYPYLDPDEKRNLRFDALHGWEIVDNTARLCVMNLLLHGIGFRGDRQPDPC
jgi:hypothetical protein